MNLGLRLTSFDRCWLIIWAIIALSHAIGFIE
jgi:hypothetical protein